MSRVEPLVSIGLPVRNGERSLCEAVESVLAQDHGHLELVISDNASNDGTQEICRHFARSDDRVHYHRQPRDIGLVANFNTALHLARGTYFKWIGDDDWLTPCYVPRCIEALDGDASLILVTTQQAHVSPDGAVVSATYDRRGLRSDRAVERFAEMLRLVNESHLILDPLYGMMRRARIVGLPRPNMLFEDQIFAARLALAGPFGHIGDVLSYRRSKPFPRLAVTARRLGVPSWQASVATTLQCRELLTAACDAELCPRDLRQARVAIAHMFLRRQRLTVARRSRKLAGMASRAPGAEPRHRRRRRRGDAKGLHVGRPVG
jgi:glycosyltransferase involved in cell wall biosynthesis